MEQKTIAVLFGGRSTEYEISLQSAYSVIKNLDSKKYHVIMLGITRWGEWLKYSGDISHIQDDTWHESNSCIPAVISPDCNMHGVLVMDDGKITKIPIDVAFPVLHGKNGEDGTIQGLLKMADIPCVGCGTLSSALCMDKDMAHRLVSLAGIKTPNCIVLNSPISDDELIKQIVHLKYPLFVKPVNAGSSFGITKVFYQNKLTEAVSVAFQHDRKVIIEETIEGFEVGCAILGNKMLTIGEVDEIELSKGFFDYTEKYTLKNSKIHMPARIDEETASRIKETAKIIYRSLGCKGYARVDMFLTPRNEIVFNEVNTIPGFTAHSRYPNMLKGIGMAIEQIIDELIRLALKS
ncbi:MAG: D-alanine--D-serine ligase VanG [Ruminiclostridium sp.]|jgi:D-alanine---D-serine ligase|nr:D-alanine--D-serine ligase VanG [Ruminiclostridium sp.]